MQRNADSGHFYGGIYASCLAKELGVSPLPNDPILPTQYLDFEAMKRHKFIKATTTNYTYSLMFNKSPTVHVVLHGHVLFDYHSKRRYYVLDSEAYKYNAVVEAS